MKNNLRDSIGPLSDTWQLFINQTQEPEMGPGQAHRGCTPTGSEPEGKILRMEWPLYLKMYIRKKLKKKKNPGPDAKGHTTRLDTHLTACFWT
jgi:hypothetical protein